MTKPFVQYKDVHKSFGDVEVLKGIDLDIMPGEKVAVIGPSGSGKTTIIRMLMTLEEPTSGSIIVDGENLWQVERNGELVRAKESHLREVRGSIGMVFQHFNLFPHMTILENCMTAPINVKKEDKKEARERSIEMLEKVGLGDKLDNYPNQLSGGQKQRVAMARALVMRPKIMLFDEVTSALDPELVEEVLEVIRDLALINVKKEDKKEARERSIEMLEKVGLGDKLDNYPNQLSGGQKQRVAMARALVMRPKIMLFDEVTSALDPELVEEVLEVIRDLAEDGDMAMVLVTHEMEFALDIADRVVFLDKGVIAESGPPSQVLEHSKNERLQSFLRRFRR